MEKNYTAHFVFVFLLVIAFFSLIFVVTPLR